MHPARFVLAALAGLALAAPARAADPPLPDDLKLVPPDAAAFFAARTAELAKTQFFQRIRKELLTGAIRKELDAAAENPGQIGPSLRPFLPSDAGLVDVLTTDAVERLTTFVRLDEKGEFGEVGQVWVTYRPYDRAAILREMKNVREKSHGGKTYYLAGPKDGMMPAVAFLSDRIILRGMEEGVRRRLEGAYKEPTGTLAGLLRDAAAGPNLVAAADLARPDVRKALGRQLADLAQAAPYLSGLETVTIAVGVERTTALRLRLTFATAEQARQAEAGMKDIVTTFRAFAGKLAQMSPAERAASKTPKSERAVIHLGEELKAAEVRSQDRAAEVAVRIRVEGLETDFLGDIAGAMAETLQAVAKVRTAAARMQSGNNLKQLGLALHNYHDSNQAFPAAAVCDKAGKPLLSWRVAILPYLGYEDLYKEFKLDEPWDSEHNKKLIARMPKTYAVSGERPRDYEKLKAEGYTFYQAVVGSGAAFESPAGRGPAANRGLGLVQFTDGSSNTILLVEADEPVVWTRPADYDFDPKKPLPKLGGPFAAGAQVLLADGSIRMLPRDTPEKEVKAAMTRNGGEPDTVKAWEDDDRRRPPLPLPPPPLKPAPPPAPPERPKP